MSKGMVYLVGAGPGASDLITVRGRELIEQCDVLVYDYLVYDKLLTWTRPDCEQVYVGKRSGYHTLPQEEIQKLLIQHAQAGKRVVRLKGGDPFIFGRGGEEAEALMEEGILFEVVPGVTSSLGAAAYLGIPLTHRGESSAVTFITGHENPGKVKETIDWKSYAALDTTLCIYMGMTNLPHIMQELQAGGMDADTPVAVVRWATLARQESAVGTVATIADLVKKRDIKPPAMIIVGRVAKDAPRLAWHENKPLYGKRIAITRTREQASELSDKLEEQGAKVLELPLIQVIPQVDEQVKKEVFSELGSYDWICFTSPNGVRCFFDLFLKEFKDIRSMGFMRIAAIGPGTAKAIEKMHLEVELIPEKHTGAGMGEALLEIDGIDTAKILVVKGSKGGEDLIKPLEARWVIVDRLEVYKTVPTDLSEHAMAQKFRELGADAITFTSSSTAKSFAKQAKSLQLQKGAQAPKPVSMGPITSKTMTELGMPVSAEAKVQTLDGLVDAVVEALKQ